MTSLQILKTLLVLVPGSDTLLVLVDLSEGARTVSFRRWVGDQCITIREDAIDTDGLHCTSRWQTGDGVVQTFSAELSLDAILARLAPGYKIQGLVRKRDHRTLELLVMDNSEGLPDIAADRLSEPALLAMIGAARLSEHGIKVPIIENEEIPLEHKLFDLLCNQHGSQAYRHYRTLIRLLVSLENALDNVRNK